MYEIEVSICEIAEKWNKQMNEASTGMFTRQQGIFALDCFAIICHYAALEQLVVQCHKTKDNVLSKNKSYSNQFTFSVENFTTQFLSVTSGSQRLPSF